MTNEGLASLILKIDPTAKSWVYNWYCGNCARFFYPDDNLAHCRKCHAPKHGGIPRPIPFTSSATALEKLVIWLREFREKSGNNIQIRSILADIQIIIGSWIDSTQRDYKQAVVDSVAGRLATILKQQLDSQAASLLSSSPIK